MTPGGRPTRDDRERRAAWSPVRLALGLVEAARYGAYLARLAPNRRAGLRMVWASVMLATLRRLGAPSPPWTLSLAKDGRRFSLTVDDLGDLAAVGEVLLEEEYGVSLPRHPRLIIDLGSHIGTSVIFFRLRYPLARIVALEPDPRNFAKLRRNVSRLPGVEIHELAATGEDGSAALHSADSPLAASLVPPARVSGATLVTTVSLDTLIERLGVGRVDLLKLDVEGMEFELLARSQRLAAIDAIVGEFHPILSGQTPEAFVELLKDFEVALKRVGPDSCGFTARRRPSAGVGGAPNPPRA
jgi:FkbM family methyltransferase